MNRRQALLLTAALITVGLASLGIVWMRSEPSPVDPVDIGDTQAVQGPTGRQAAIYFPATSGMLEPELREVPADLDPAARKRWLAEQLVTGPKTEGLRSALPNGTQVAGVFAAPDGTVYIDFTIPEAVGMGSTEELLAIYSIVNTMLLDDEAARWVVILINGRQRDSIAGHVDTSMPLAARPDLIREAG